jgi:alkylation response protein AidB-like acyl-CoA dehydrogenase
MNLEPSQEQAAIAAVTDEYLSRELPMARLRELAADVDGPAIDDRTWQRCAELGWLALGLTESAGGVGLGLAEEVMLFREFGRHLAPGPFLGSVLGARVAASAGAGDITAAIVAGQLRVGLLTEDLAVDARQQDLVLVIEDNAAELREIAAAVPVPGIDPGARFARVVTGSPVARVEGADILDRARVLAAAQQLGIIEAVRDMSAAYARTRTQFGKPIGSFQAVKHRCADMAVAAYAAIGEVFQAAVLVDAGTTDAPFHAATAYVLATRGAAASTADNIQNHGGIGFTWEQESHLYLKRAFLIEHLLGEQRRAYVSILAPSRHEFR